LIEELPLTRAEQKLLVAVAAGQISHLAHDRYRSFEANAFTRSVQAVMALRE
jgi:hypothetical protein